MKISRNINYSNFIKSLITIHEKAKKSLNS